MPGASIVILSLLAMAWSANRPRSVGPIPTAPGTHPPETPRPPADALPLPGIRSIVDAAAFGDRWLLLDPIAGRIHVVGPRRGRIESLGRSSAGALRRAALLAVRGDTIVVGARFGGAIHRLDGRGRMLGRHRLTVGECRTPRIVDGVSRPEGMVFLVVCPGRGLDVEAYAVLERSPGNASVLASTGARPDPASPVDPLFTPVLAVHPRGIVFGSAGAGCLNVIAPDGARVDRLCRPPIESAPLPPDVRTELDRAAPLARALGSRLSRPDSLPSFDDLALGLGSTGWVWRTPERADGSRRVVAAGNDRLRSLGHAPIAFLSPGSALLAWPFRGRIFLTTRDVPTLPADIPPSYTDRAFSLKPQRLDSRHAHPDRGQRRP